MLPIVHGSTAPQEILHTCVALHLREEVRAEATEEAPTFPEKLPTLKAVTESLIEEALSRAKGNQAIAAGLLGITPQALSKRLKRRKASQSETEGE